MKPDYEDTEWRKAIYDDWFGETPTPTPWWEVVIGGLVMFAVATMLVWCVVH
jgi:hypothetical protein